MNIPKASSRFDFRQYFVRGESLVATTGIAFIAILAFAVGGVVWVSAQTIDDSVIAQAEEQVRQTSTLIATQAEARLNDRDLSSARRLLIDAAASGLVEESEITVPDLGVIATSNTAQDFIKELPENWQTAEDVQQSVIHNPDTQQTIIYEPLTVNGRSGMTLKVVVSKSMQVIGADSIRASSVGIGSVGLVLMLLVYRRFRNRLGALAAIGEALKVAAEGERRTECLLVGENLGIEAEIWNTLLSERDVLEQVNSDHEISEAVVSGGDESIGLPAACNTLTQGVVLVGSDLQVIYANGAACVFLRVERETFVDSTIEQIAVAEQVLPAVQSVLDEQGPTRQVVELGDVKDIDTQGAVLRLVVTRVQSEDIPRAMIFIEDVTQQRLADDSQNAFIAQATHELRTPLTTIRLYTEEAIESGSDDGEIREKALNVINSETRRLERIVGDMLCVAEIEAGSLSIHRDSLRTEQLFTELEQDYQAQANDKTIELVFDLPPKFPTINADRDRLGQAFHNLVGNAIKYTPSGGKVEVRVAFDDNDALQVDVIDNGIGIDESQHERIFDRFCRADDRRIAKVTGSGLGLALARQIARLHGGDVTVESGIDQGSTFSLTIPGTQETAKAA